MAEFQQCPIRLSPNIIHHSYYHFWQGGSGLPYPFSILLTKFCRVSDEYRKSIYAMIDDVHWECHLSQADFTIQDHLLTVHYLFTKRNDLIVSENPTAAMAWLSVSFLKGCLAWFRVSLGSYYYSCLSILSGQKHCNRGMDINHQSEEYRDEEYQGEGFESWCEEFIAAKELAT